jgi:hypothetical protein
MMRNGELWERTTPERLIEGKDCGLWATPQASDNRKAVSGYGKSLRNRENVPELGTTDGWLSPELSEWLMDWPDNWTDLKPLEMDKFRQWQRSHGVCSEVTHETH